MGLASEVELPDFFQMASSMTPTSFTHGSSGAAQQGAALWTTLFITLCPRFSRRNVATSYAFMGETCCLDKVKEQGVSRQESGEGNARECGRWPRGKTTECGTKRIWGVSTVGEEPQKHTFLQNVT